MGLSSAHPAEFVSSKRSLKRRLVSPTAKIELFCLSDLLRKETIVHLLLKAILKSNQAQVTSCKRRHKVYSNALRKTTARSRESNVKLHGAKVAQNEKIQ